jgi:hypothetical protein
VVSGWRVEAHDGFWAQVLASAALPYVNNAVVRCPPDACICCQRTPPLLPA